MALTIAEMPIFEVKIASKMISKMSPFSMLFELQKSTFFKLEKCDFMPMPGLAKSKMRCFHFVMKSQNQPEN